MRFDVRFNQTDQKLRISFESDNSAFNPKFKNFQQITAYVGGGPYTGEYTVTPKVEAQTMPTKEKVMLDDVTIRAIPYFDVSNTSGGRTVYIGNEV